MMRERERTGVGNDDFFSDECIKDGERERKGGREGGDNFWDNNSNKDENGRKSDQIIT